MKFITISDACKQVGVSYLGGINISSKMLKNKKISHNYTYILYLSPAKTSGYNVCNNSTSECRLGCLATSGHAAMDLISNANIIKNTRIKKTRLFFEETSFFMQWLIAEIKIYQNKAKKDGYSFSVRLNGTSDIDWSKIFINGKNIFEIFKNVQFYDYTKQISKFNEKPNNYHLTYSYTGLNWNNCKILLEHGVNVAVVFNVKKNKKLPETFENYKVFDGDLTDYRINDTKGIIIGLKFKEIADKQVSNQLKQKGLFVVQPNDIRCNNIKDNVQVNENIYIDELELV